MLIYLYNLIFLGFFHYLFSFKYKSYGSFYWYLILFYFCLFIGFKYEVSPDWVGYKNIYDQFNILNFQQYIDISSNDLLFSIILYISKKLNFGLVGVNLIVSVIFIIIFYFYTKNFKNKFLALIACYPIIIIVLQMGFVRQGLALSFVLLMYYFLSKKNFSLSFFSLLLASLSHKSSLIFLPLYFFFLFFFKLNLKNNKNSYLLIFFFLFLILLIYIFYSSKLFHFFKFYFIYQENLALASFYRGILIVFFSFYFLKFNKNLKINNFEKKIYQTNSFFVLFLFLFLFITPLPADRLLLYFHFLPVFILGNINLKNSFFIWIITYFYISYFFIWLFFGINSHKYIPYKTVLSLIFP